jgi:hypothetical protein
MKLKDDLQKLFGLLNDGYKITATHISWEKTRKPELAVEVKLRKNKKNIILSSSQEKCVSHVIHLFSIPHIEDDNADFVYVDDNNKYGAKFQEE